MFLFAFDLGDFIRIGVLILFFLGPALSKLFENKQKPGELKQPQPRPQPRPVPGARQQANRPAPQQKPADRLEMEIEDFLKRAGKQGQNKPIQAEVIEPTLVSTKRSKPKPISRPSLKVQEAAIGQESVAEHVQHHIGSNPVGQNSGRLGSSVTREIDSMESHVHEVFDHKLGSLKESLPAVTNEKDDIDDRGTDSSVWEDKGTKTRRAEAATALRNKSLFDALRDPDSIRQAIILQEILKRPDFDDM